MNLDNSTVSIDVPGGKDGTVNHRGNYTRPDGTPGSVTGTVNEIAQRAFNAGMQWAQKGKTDSKQEQGQTVEQYALKWVESKKQSCQASGWGTTQEGHLKNHLLPKVGKFDIKEITNSEIKQAIAGLRQPNGAPYSQKYCQAIISTAREMFAQAFRDGVIDRNPLPSGERIHNPGIKPKKKEEQRLTERECFALFDEVLPKIPKEQTQERLFIAMALLTGCRRQELAALKWEDIDDIESATPFIHITHKVVWARTNKGVYQEGAKTENGIRDIPITQRLKPFLADAMPTDRTGFVFRGKKSNPDGKEPMTADGFTRLYERATAYLPKETVERIGRLTAYTGRRTYADTGRRAGVSSLDIGKMMGHSANDIEQITQGVYMNVDNNDKTQSAKMIDKYFDDHLAGRAEQPM